MTTANVAHEEPWTADDSTFGARLALIRQHMEWGNLKEGAIACGIPVETWRAWERDGVLPRNYLEICAKIAEVTGCDYGWLVDRRPSGASLPTRPRFQLEVAASNDEPDVSTHQPGLMVLVRSP